MDEQFNSACKRQRLDSDESKDDGNRAADVWGDDEDDDAFTAEQLAHIDDLVSQACSQSTSMSTSSKMLPNFDGGESGTIIGSEDGGRTTLTTSTAALTWTVSGVVPETGQQAIRTKTPQATVVKAWNTPLARGASVQELERQKQELQRRRQETIDAQEQVKSLRGTLACKDLEAARTKREVELLRQQIETLTNERKQADKRSEKLQLELDFMNQEASASKWSSSQQQTRMAVPKRPVPPSHCKQALVKHDVQLQSLVTSSKAKESHHGFPTSSSFGRRLDVVDNSLALNASSEMPAKDEVVKQKMTMPRHVETGPGLMALLLSMQDDDRHADPILVELLKKHRFASENCDSLTDVINSSRSASNSSSSMKSIGACLNPSTDFKFGLLKLLKEDNHVGDTMEEKQQQDGDGRIPAELLMSRLGLQNDCVTVLLPTIEDTLGLLESTRPPPPPVSSRAQESLTSIGHGLGSTSIGSRNWISATLASSTCSSAETIHSDALSLRVSAALKLLQVIVYYSPKVRHCLMTECYVAHPLSLASTASCRSFMDSVTSKTQCFILTKLIKFCEQSVEMENKRLQELLLVILDILMAVASYCSVEQLIRFQPVVSLTLVQNCSTLALRGSVFLQLLKFLTTLFASPAIVYASSCNHDEFCLWKPLTDTWKRSASDLPLEFANQIDLQMIILLTVCWTHEGTTPSCLTSEECHCPFEVTSSLILFLDRQRRSKYEKATVDVGSGSDELLRKGISLLLRMAQSNKQFGDHYRPLDVEFFAFLYWLPRVHRHLKLGKAAEALMEMWSVSLEEELT